MHFLREKIHLKESWSRVPCFASYYRKSVCQAWMNLTDIIAIDLEGFKTICLNTPVLYAFLSWSFKEFSEIISFRKTPCCKEFRIYWIRGTLMFSITVNDILTSSKRKFIFQKSLTRKRRENLVNKKLGLFDIIKRTSPLIIFNMMTPVMFFNRWLQRDWNPELP